MNDELEEMCEADEKIKKAYEILDEAKQLENDAYEYVEEIRIEVSKRENEAYKEKIKYQRKYDEMKKDAEEISNKRKQLNYYIEEKGREIIEFDLYRIKNEYKRQISLNEKLIKTYGVIIAIIFILNLVNTKTFFVDVGNALINITKAIFVAIEGLFSLGGYMAEVTDGIDNMTLVYVVEFTLKYVLPIIVLVVTILGIYIGIIKMIKKMKEIISKWDIYILPGLSLIIVFYGKYIKLLIPINLFVLLLMVIIIAIVIRKYVEDCFRSRRRY